ncbi:D-glucuronyl C5-epimerase family protein [Micromonospora sp. H33]|uniref:D-glucuronyl C5-epimerase family protein n=1 Tax=Micromonospora sp. H33 TaxID=3452215 RepID=UPI003F88EA5B
MADRRTGTNPSWSRRQVLTAVGVAGAAPLVAPGAAEAAPVTPTSAGRWVGPGGPGVVDPAYEISPPMSESAVAEAPRLSAKQSRQLASGPSDAARTLSSDAAAADVPFTFRYDPFDIRDLPETLRPYHSNVRMPIVDAGPHDEHGVRMALLGGKLYDHPVNQAQYGLNLLESYRLTGYQVYLHRAMAQAQRLIDRRVVHEGGWFYPYQFRHALHRSADILEPPWYSMMAQGQAMSLFVRLAQILGKGSRWREAADATFASYLVPPVAGKPWGVYVKDGLLWLEEYAHPTQVRGDLTYNGHIFSAFGLWDYWTLSRDAGAKLMLQGAITTARDVHQLIRTRQWRSKYCLTHQKDAGNYHTTHIGQHSVLHAVTGDSTFAQIMDLYYSDHPPRGVSGTIMLAAGEHVGYKFDAAGTIVATKRLSLTRRSNAPSSERLKVLRQTGIWYAISGGSLNGYLVKEIPGKSYQIGRAAAIGYRIPRPAVVAAAPVKAYTIDAAGQMTSVVTDLAVGANVTVDLRAALNGVQHYRLAAGTYAGRWVGLTTLTGR